MRVRINKTRQHDTPAGIDHCRIRIDQLFDLSSWSQLSQSIRRERIVRRAQ